MLSQSAHGSSGACARRWCSRVAPTKRGSCPASSSTRRATAARVGSASRRGSSGSSGSGSGGGASAAPQCSMPRRLDGYASLVFTSSIFASLPLCHFASLPICLFDLCLFASLPLCHFAFLPLCLFASCSLPGMCALRVCAPTHTRSTILSKPLERSKDGIGSGSSSGSSGSADGAGGARTALFVFVMLCACVATRVVYRGVSNE